MSNVQIIQILIVVLIISVLIFSYLIYIGRKQIEEKEKYSIYKYGKKKKGNIYYRLYDFFIQWPITKRYFKRITRQYEIILPGDKKNIAVNTSKTVLLIWLIDALIIILLFAFKPSFYSAILTIAYLFIANNQLLYLILENNDIKVLRQFDKFIGDVRHNFQSHGMVDEAVYDCLEKADYPIKLHAAYVHKILNADDIEEELSKYNEIVPNRFIKTFLALCVMILKFGDKKVDNQSLFMINLKYLRQEINIEIINRNKMKYQFSGLVFITIMPILFLNAIQDWAISSFNGLKDYYYGAFGILTMVLIFITTLISYKVVNHLKEPLSVEVKNYVILDYLTKIPIIKKATDNILNKNYGKTLRIQDLLKRAGESITPKQFLLKRILYSFVAFISCIIISLGIHAGKRNQLLNNTDNISYASSILTEKNMEQVRSTIVDYVKMYKNSEVNAEEIEKSLLESRVIKSKQLATMTAEEIVSRINKYQFEYYKWYEFLIALIIVVTTYYIPYFSLILVKKIRQMVMDDEVIQFHSIILMLMYIDRMTVETILEWMANFANLFKNSIQDCLNDLQSGEIEALEELKIKEPYEPFVRIIENLQMCDKTGIQKAFNEIAVERFNYQEKRKLENEIYTNNKTVYATIMAWLPFGLTVGLYLIIPFVIEGLTQLIIYLDQMQSIY